MQRNWRTWHLMDRRSTLRYYRSDVDRLEENDMDSWKKALLLGSIGAAVIFFMKKRYPAGVLASGVSLAMLASEYPEQFETMRRSLPDYFERGMRVMDMAGQAGKRITEAAGRGAAGVWEEFGG
jgi:hypothetical protein